MNNLTRLVPFALLIFTFLILPGQNLAQNQAPYTVDYYYKIKWGYFNEFLDLYKKNHYPILAELKKRGEIIGMSAAYPLYHSGESLRWDFRFTIVFKDFEAAHNDEISEEITLELYPDQDNFKKEEQRRFELFLEHLDVPLKIETFSDW
ncbi:MAG: hypothetical protein OEQ53_05965 [Saprospiraceae bacterium]|nr:hypothetical protein [Saprospiraceae bacterium]